MRILVLSDLHRRRSYFEQAVEQQPDAKQIIFLGDGAEEAAELATFYPDRTFHILSGNCDFNSLYPATKVLELHGIRILATHGHPYSVKSGTGRLYEAAKASGAKLALYGHTHIPKTEYRDGIHLVCPGALCGCGSPAGYAVIDLVDSGIMPIHIKL